MELINGITKKIVQVIVVLITIMLLFSMVEFIFLLGRAVFTQHGAFSFSVEPIDKSKLFFVKVQGLIAAILLLTILIELIASLIEYLKVGSANYVTVITEIALIAIVRHLLVIDFEHVPADSLLSLSALILVLGLFYLATSKRLFLKHLKSKKKNSDKNANDLDSEQI